MKNIFYILLALFGVLLTSCSNDDNEPYSNEISRSIQQYKWVCRTSMIHL